MVIALAREIIRTLDPLASSREQRANLDEKLSRVLILAGWSDIAREVLLDAMAMLARQRFMDAADRDAAYLAVCQMIACGRLHRYEVLHLAEAAPFAHEFAQAFGYRAPAELMTALRDQDIRPTEERMCVFAAAMVLKIVLA